MHSELSVEGPPELSSPADGESMPSAWADDLAPLDLDSDPEAVTAPARRRPSRSALRRRRLANEAPAADTGARDAVSTHPPSDTAAGLDDSSLGSSSDGGLISTDDDATGTYSVVGVLPPAGMWSDTGAAVASSSGVDVRRLTGRRLARLNREERRQLFADLAVQHVVLGAELVDVAGRQERRQTTACALVLLVNRHVSRHRARPLVAEMFAAAPEALMEQVAVDRRLSRAVADQLPTLAAQMPPEAEPLLRQALASWLRQRSATPTQAVARLVRQAPTYDRHHNDDERQAPPERCASLLVAALEVLIAQQLYPAGECAVAVARVVDGPSVIANHWGATTTRLCERAAVGFAVEAAPLR